MDEKMKTLHELCETISRELEDANEKIRKAGGKLSAGDVDYVDKLTHALKSIKTTLAMMEAEDEDGYSGRYMGPRYYPTMSYERGGSYADGRMSDGRGASYARGRTGNVRRDSMGRYSRDGYSYDDAMDSLLDDMRGMMGSMPEDKRREMQRFIDKMEH